MSLTVVLLTVEDVETGSYSFVVLDDCVTVLGLEESFVVAFATFCDTLLSFAILLSSLICEIVGEAANVASFSFKTIRHSNSEFPRRLREEGDQLRVTSLFFFRLDIYLRRCQSKRRNIFRSYIRRLCYKNGCSTRCSGSSFVSGDDDDAIEKYTMSLAFAKSRESMGLAFANRSAALYRKQLYRECLIDIDAALGHGYPEDKKIKLKERAVKAVASLRQLCSGKDQNMNDLPAASVPRAPPPEDSSNTTSNGTSNGGSSEFKDYALIKNIIEDGKSSDKSSQRSGSSCSDDGLAKESLEEMMSKSSRGPPRYVVEEGELALAYGANDEVPALSKGATIVYTEKYGRHLVATQHFKAGDIILTENPYAYVIYREKYYTHCHHCLTRSFNLISCPHCPIAQYCSEKCMRDAWQLAHQLECPIHAVFSKLLNVDKDKIRILTKITRMLIIATESGQAIDELRKDCLEAEKNPDKRKQGFTDAGIFDSASARCALSLATNLPVRPPIEISAFSCISALAVILLALRTKFFRDTTHTAAAEGSRREGRRHDILCRHRLSQLRHHIVQFVLGESLNVYLKESNNYLSYVYLPCAKKKKTTTGTTRAGGEGRLGPLRHCEPAQSLVLPEHVSPLLRPADGDARPRAHQAGRPDIHLLRGRLSVHGALGAPTEDGRVVLLRLRLSGLRRGLAHLSGHTAQSRGLHRQDQSAARGQAQALQAEAAGRQVRHRRGEEHPRGALRRGQDALRGDRPRGPVSQELLSRLHSKILLVQKDERKNN
ncbi:unnamed protein product [Trichogramma brassicae]|uniref:MYND-type domain-containing protein n=1 Tax=Trichogramma brassicae TaxID=86971 RepID=A0A6H5HX59_9HYME|nr:unnamed protein product [Trichogramma brassicae]